MIQADRGRDAILMFALSCGLAVVWCLAFASFVAVKNPQQMFAESGPIESASAMCLIVGALALLGDMILRRNPWRWHLALLVLACGLRELDWDKAFTDRGVLSLGLYLDSTSMDQKIAGALVVTLLIWAGLRLVRCNLKAWLAGLRGRQLWAWLMTMAITLYVVAKSLDGLARKLAPWGIELSTWINNNAGYAEEIMELFAAVLILQVVGMSLLQGWAQR